MHTKSAPWMQESSMLFYFSSLSKSHPHVMIESMLVFIVYVSELLCNARNVGLKINNVERFALSTPCSPRSGMQCQGKGYIQGTVFVPEESRLSLSIVCFQCLTRSSQGRTCLCQPTRGRKNALFQEQRPWKIAQSCILSFVSSGMCVFTKEKAGWL